MTERTYRWLFWSLALIGLCLDQSSKYSVFTWLYNDGHGNRHEVFPGVFRLVCSFDEDARSLVGEAPPVVNSGALWGLGSEYKWLANSVFAGVSVAAAVAIIWWSTRRSMARDWKLCAALGLILAGTLGNLYDRVTFAGVRDFLHFYWIQWPVFNIADCCLVCGAFLLVTQALWSRSPATEESTAPHMPMTPEPAEARSA